MTNDKNSKIINIKQYDKVLLQSGEYAYIVEILDQGKVYIADIDKDDGETYTETVYQKDIKSIEYNNWLHLLTT